MRTEGISIGRDEDGYVGMRICWENGWGDENGGRIRMCRDDGKG